MCCFDCVDFDIECKNISIPLDIGGLRLSAKQSESMLLKKFVLAGTGCEAYQIKTW